MVEQALAAQAAERGLCALDPPGLEERIDRVLEELQRQAEPEDEEELGYARDRLVLLCRAGPWVLELAVMVAGLVYYVALVLVRWFVTPAEPSPPPLRAVRRHLR